MTINELAHIHAGENMESICVGYGVNPEQIAAWKILLV